MLAASESQCTGCLRRTRSRRHREFEVFCHQRPGNRLRGKGPSRYSGERGISIDAKWQVGRTAQRGHQRPPFFQVGSRDGEVKRGRRSQQSGCLNFGCRRRQVKLRQFQRIARGPVLALQMRRHRQFARRGMQGRSHLEREAYFRIPGTSLPERVHVTRSRSGRMKVAQRVSGHIESTGHLTDRNVAQTKMNGAALHSCQLRLLALFGRRPGRRNHRHDLLSCSSLGERAECCAASYPPARRRQNFRPIICPAASKA